MRIMAWNCRGLNTSDDPTIPFLIWTIQKFAIDVLFLMETKADYVIIGKVARLLNLVIMIM